MNDPAHAETSYRLRQPVDAPADWYSRVYSSSWAGPNRELFMSP